MERITHIFEKDGITPRPDVQHRIGMEGQIMPLIRDCSMTFIASLPVEGILTTSRVVEWYEDDGSVTVETTNSIYHFEKLTSKEEVKCHF